MHGGRTGVVVVIADVDVGLVGLADFSHPAPVPWPYARTLSSPSRCGMKICPAWSAVRKTLT